MSSVNLVVNFLLFYYTICNFRYVFYLQNKDFTTATIIIIIWAMKAAGFDANVQ